MVSFLVNELSHLQHSCSWNVVETDPKSACKVIKSLRNKQFWTPPLESGKIHHSTESSEAEILADYRLVNWSRNFFPSSNLANFNRYMSKNITSLNKNLNENLEGVGHLRSVPVEAFLNQNHLIVQRCLIILNGNENYLNIFTITIYSNSNYI